MDVSCLDAAAAAEPGLSDRQSSWAQPSSKVGGRDTPAMRNAYEKAARLVRKNRERLLRILGVHGLGVGKSADHGGGEGVCLIVYVDSTVDRRALPDEIEGFPVYTVP